MSKPLFLWVGRKVLWHDRKAVIVKHIDKKYVMVALESRQHMTFMVKREEIETR